MGTENSASVPMLCLSRHNSTEAFHEDSQTRAYPTYVNISACPSVGHERVPHGPLFSSLSRRHGVASGRRWAAQRLIYQALLMAFEPSATLKDRFTGARQALIEMFPSRRRPGRSYQGFVKALRALPPSLMQAVDAHLRDCHVRVAGALQQRWGWTLLACDGTRVEVPRTDANEAAFGCAGRTKTGPQLALTTLYHMGTGLPWSWRIGPGPEAERCQLRDMLDEIPTGALLVADAGFTGFALLRQLVEQGLFFLIRVGANVTLLRDLGLEVETDGQTVWLWPTNRRHEAPLTLRLIHVATASENVYLVTNVVDRARLSDDVAARLYRMRWGVEVFYRGFKQTLGHHRMCSASPELARLELHWALCAMLLLGLMSADALRTAGRDPLRLSVAGALRIVRQAMRTPRAWRPHGDLRRTLATATRDNYRRRGSKNARDWPHKKYEPPPGAPKIRPATERERTAAQRIYKAA